MKILLLGEYSNVHNVLAKGLRTLGHDVTVASDGDSWKNYPRDIDLYRSPGRVGKLRYVLRLLMSLPKMKGYDIVQLINPMFLELKAERHFSVYNYLRRNNKKVIMGAFGMDYYWMHVNDTVKPLRYSDSNIGENLRLDFVTEAYREEWIGTEKQRLNEYIASDSDTVVAGLYEYWVTYNAVSHLREKLRFIPFPIECTNPEVPRKSCHDGKIRFFIGVSGSRHVYKGTDIMLEAVETLKRNYPDMVELRIASKVPFAEYQHMMNTSDCILDQLYSYTPAMNALLAMSKGIIVVGGGEPENYEILGEKELRPIVNVQPTYESCYHELEQLVLHPERIPDLQRQSVEYVRRHHDYVKVAREYVEMYKSL